VAGTFPALNARTPEEFDAWLGEIDAALAAARAADPGARRALRRQSDPARLQPAGGADLELICKHGCPS
jgi:hypothetical protein